MSWLTSLALYIIHAVYLLASSLSFLRNPLTYTSPRPIDAKRKLTPKHLALVFTGCDSNEMDNLEDILLENIEGVVSWCHLSGIQRLTVYDREGLISRSSLNLRKRLIEQTGVSPKESSDESEIEYPLTPPLTDESRSLSPDREVTPDLRVITINATASRERRRDQRGVVKRRNSSKKQTNSSISPVTLHLISRESGKPAIASVANSLFQTHQRSERDDLNYSINDITSILEGELGFPEPDLMIVHQVSPSHPRKPLELYGFPPWQIRLTEIRHTRDRSLSKWWNAQNPQFLDEIDFREALDAFDSAEMRVGR
ncbi:unnamed protein product [Somion occarium]|uniref:ditrans,polycis-polyprenyl diphosphate synthase [(2E,6E)-farnesyldiphosphate specific] n=1 Tax=Somion occarium TaxID=3059160 RepID=A0ABP1CLZ4_9APHY